MLIDMIEIKKNKRYNNCINNKSVPCEKNLFYNRIND